MFKAIWERIKARKLKRQEEAAQKSTYKPYRADSTEYDDEISLAAVIPFGSFNQIDMTSMRQAIFANTAVEEDDRCRTQSITMSSGDDSSTQSDSSATTDTGTCASDSGPSSFD
jgi:hypothetical protein